MPVRVISLSIMNIANIMCNFYLYMYLEDKRKESTGKKLKLPKVGRPGFKAVSESLLDVNMKAIWTRLASNNVKLKDWYFVPD